MSPYEMDQVVLGSLCAVDYFSGCHFVRFWRSSGAVSDENTQLRRFMLGNPRPLQVCVGNILQVCRAGVNVKPEILRRGSDTNHAQVLAVIGKRLGTDASS